MNTTKKAETPSAARIWEMYCELGSVHKIQEVYGVNHATAHRILKKAGYTLKGAKFTPAEDDVIQRYYADTPVENFNLDDLVALLPDRQHKSAKANICARAKQLGLTDKNRTPSAQTKRKASELTRQQLKEKGHPRGMLGKKHTPEVREVVGQKAREMWAGWTPEQRRERQHKMMVTKAQRGNLVHQRPHTSWRAGWRTVGSRAYYFRSQWEANFACYLEWQREQGLIRAWAFEPMTYFLKGAEGQTLAYIPDFRVFTLSEAVIFYEVKGWMDARSILKLRLMAEQHPHVMLTVIGGAEYQELSAWAAAIVPGWEK